MKLASAKEARTNVVQWLIVVYLEVHRPGKWIIGVTSLPEWNSSTKEMYIPIILPGEPIFLFSPPHSTLRGATVTSVYSGVVLPRITRLKL